MAARGARLGRGRSGLPAIASDDELLQWGRSLSARSRIRRRPGADSGVEVDVPHVALRTEPRIRLRRRA